MPGRGRTSEVDDVLPSGTTASIQARYHDERFGHLMRPAEVAVVIEDLSGALDPRSWLGLDQMGHLGPHGCALAAERLGEHLPSDGTIVELGAGYGGALRDIVDRLAQAGSAPHRAVGVDVVLDHCRAAQEISSSIARSPTAFAAADAVAVPLRGGVVDAVVVIGSMPHFASPDLVVREAARILRPGGRLVLFEEVSLTPDDAPPPSTAFVATHPDAVFHRSTLAGRSAELARAGFVDVVIEDVGTWARDLLVARLKALHLLRGTAERVYGGPEVEAIARTLDAAVGELDAGHLLPRLIVARTRP